MNNQARQWEFRARIEKTIKNNLLSAETKIVSIKYLIEKYCLEKFNEEYFQKNIEARKLALTILEKAEKKRLIFWEELNLPPAKPGK